MAPGRQRRAGQLLPDDVGVLHQQCPTADRGLLDQPVRLVEYQAPLQRSQPDPGTDPPHLAVRHQDGGGVGVRPLHHLIGEDLGGVHHAEQLIGALQELTDQFGDVMTRGGPGRPLRLEGLHAGGPGGEERVVVLAEEGVARRCGAARAGGDRLHRSCRSRRSGLAALRPPADLELLDLQRPGRDHGRLLGGVRVVGTSLVGRGRALRPLGLAAVHPRGRGLPAGCGAGSGGRPVAGSRAGRGGRCGTRWWTGGSAGGPPSAAPLAAVPGGLEEPGDPQQQRRPGDRQRNHVDAGHIQGDQPGPLGVVPRDDQHRDLASLRRAGRQGPGWPVAGSPTSRTTTSTSGPGRGCRGPRRGARSRRGCPRAAAPAPSTG